MQKSSPTTILIDYDDTLLPTTYLEENGIRIGSSAAKDEIIKTKLHELDVQIVKFLENCYKWGNPIILTNAEKEWVLMSAKAFLRKQLNLKKLKA